MAHRLNQTNERLDHLSADLVRRIDGNNQRLDRLMEGFAQRQEHLWVERRLNAAAHDLAEIKCRVGCAAFIDAGSVFLLPGLVDQRGFGLQNVLGQGSRRGDLGAGNEFAFFDAPFLDARAADQNLSSGLHIILHQIL